MEEELEILTNGQNTKLTIFLNFRNSIKRRKLNKWIFNFIFSNAYSQQKTLIKLIKIHYYFFITP